MQIRLKYFIIIIIYYYIITYEVIHHPDNTASSNMNEQASLVSTWSKQNNTKLNTKKTKEMQICFSRQPPKLDPIIIDDTEIEVVSQVKLLGVWFKNDLTWHTHIEEVHKKACKRIFYIVMMRRAVYNQGEMTNAYTSLIRSVLEYAAPVWHSSLTNEQSRLLESIQKRVLKIIFPRSSYEEALTKCDLDHLSDRRTAICRKLFREMHNPEHKLNHLLPKPKETSGLRKQNSYEPPKARTKRYKVTYIPYCLYNFQ